LGPVCAVTMKCEALQRENDHLRMENQWFRRVFKNSLVFSCFHLLAVSNVLDAAIAVSLPSICPSVTLVISLRYRDMIYTTQCVYA